MNCDFSTTPLADGTFRHVCRACGREEIKRTARWFIACGEHGQRVTTQTGTRRGESRGPCRHLGPQVDSQSCQTCRGTTTIKVFACAVFGRCQLGAYLPGVQACTGCEGFEPAAS